ncbi:unnamed protein product, partial [marine sediment metagenome]
ESLGASQLDERYPRFLTLAINGLKDLSMDLKNSVKEVILPVNSNDTVTLPSDFISYIVIGTDDGGTITSLGMNNNLAPRGDDDCGNMLSAADNENTEGSFFNYNGSSHFSKDGQFNGRDYGAGGGGSSNGVYKVYKDAGYIALSGASASNIVLRYLGAVDKVDGEFQVDEFAVESLKAWIYWKYVQRSRSYSMSEKQMAEMTYYREKKKSEKRFNRFNIVEFVNAYQSGYRSSPRI